ncbi:unnamed protein product [Gordionus sp. m RMFG-2023]
MANLENIEENDFDEMEDIIRSLGTDFDEEYFKKENEIRQSLLSNAINVYLRIRPNKRSENEKEFPFKIEDDNSITLGSHQTKSYKFFYTKIFSESSNQKDVFEICMSKSIQNFILYEKSFLLFTYGITNSGKTYTMQGNMCSIGLLPRFLATLFMMLKDNLLDIQKMSNSNGNLLSSVDTYQRFDTICNASDVADTTNPRILDLIMNEIHPLPHLPQDNSCPLADFLFYFSISFVEVYNENIFDLLDEDFSLNAKKYSHDNNKKMRVLRNHNKGAGNFAESKISTGSSVYGSSLENYSMASKCHSNNGGVFQKRRALKIGEDRDRDVYIKNLTVINVSSLSQVLFYLETGKRNLKMASTLLNYNSSRSHSIFTIKLHRCSRRNLNIIHTNEFTFCDLAGAERTVKTGNVGDRLFEARNINSSLLTLSKCLQIIKHNELHKDHPKLIPFRESKLTRLFQNYFLRANSKISMIVNISKNEGMYPETLHSLKFSALAKKIVLNNLKSFSSHHRHQYFTNIDHAEQMVDSNNQHVIVISKDLITDDGKILYDIKGNAYDIRHFEDSYEKEIQVLKQKILQKEYEVRKEVESVYLNWHNNELKNWTEFYKKKCYRTTDTFLMKIEALKDSLDVRKSTIVVDHLKKMIGLPKFNTLIRYLDKEELTAQEIKMLDLDSDDHQQMHKEDEISLYGAVPKSAFKVVQNNKNVKGDDIMLSPSFDNFNHNQHLTMLSSTMFSPILCIKPIKLDDTTTQSNSTIIVKPPLTTVNSTIIFKQPLSTIKKKNTIFTYQGPLKDIENIQENGGVSPNVRLTRTALKKKSFALNHYKPEMLGDGRGSVIKKLRLRENDDIVDGVVDLEVRDPLPTGASQRDNNFGAAQGNDIIYLHKPKKFYDIKNKLKTVSNAPHGTLLNEDMNLKDAHPTPSKDIMIPHGIVKQSKASLLRWACSPKRTDPTQGYHAKCTPSPTSSSSQHKSIPKSNIILNNIRKAPYLGGQKRVAGNRVSRNYNLRKVRRK